MGLKSITSRPTMAKFKNKLPRTYYLSNSAANNMGRWSEKK